jgi:hypothetical protein
MIRVSQAIALSFSVMAAEGCTVPVFRYALDRWPAETWTLEAPRSVFLTEPLATTLRNLGGDSPLNLTAKPLAGPDESGARLSFPGVGAERIAWAGALTPESFRVLTDSPARQSLVRRLLSGDSVVWVVVESADTAAHTALTDRLRKRLAFVESAAQLPVLDPGDPSSRLGPGPELKLALTQMAVRRDDAAEAAFVTMLAGPAGDPLVRSATAFGAAVFGRGRVFGAWPAAELSDELIDRTNLFLTRACSCEVKSLHPGWDLLLNVDWDAELRKVHEARLAPPAASLTEAPVPSVPVFVPIAAGIPQPAPAPETSSWWPLAAAGSALAVLAAVAFRWRIRRPRRV